MRFRFSLLLFLLESNTYCQSYKEGIVPDSIDQLGTQAKEFEKDGQFEEACTNFNSAVQFLCLSFYGIPNYDSIF